MRACIDSVMIQWHRLDTCLAFVASKKRPSSVLYYVLVSREFDLEIHSVLIAERQYSNASAGYKLSSYLLPRNLNRLEKGQIMQPRRAVFAQAYIQ